MRFPSINTISAELALIKRSSVRETIREGLEVRLQVLPEGDGCDWYIHTGDPSYDQDHRGYWGTGTLDRTTDCRELARSLLEEANDQQAQDYVGSVTAPDLSAAEPDGAALSCGGRESTAEDLANESYDSNQTLSPASDSLHPQGL